MFQKAFFFEQKMKRSRLCDPRNHRYHHDHRGEDDDNPRGNDDNSRGDDDDPRGDDDDPRGDDDDGDNTLRGPITTPPSTLAKTRDAIVAFAASFAADNCAFHIPLVSKRVSQYLRSELLFLVGGKELYDFFPISSFIYHGETYTRQCYALDDLMIINGFQTCGWVESVCRMQHDRSDFGLAVLRGDLWAVGGGSTDDRLKSCERLEAHSSKWVLGPDMSTAREFLAVAVLDDEVWAIGGCCCDGTVLSSCERLTASGVWIPGPAMTAPRRYHQAAVLDGVLWVVDGESQETERLDVSANRWVRGPSMISQRKEFALAAYRGLLWAVGGRCGQNALASCEYLDISSGCIWFPGPSMMADRICFGLAEHDGQLWAVGGECYDRMGSDSLRSCEILDTCMRWFSGPDLPRPICGLRCCVRP